MTLILNNKMQNWTIGNSIIAYGNANNSILIPGSASDWAMVNGLSKYFFYFKLTFILFLFVLHLWFINSNDESFENTKECKESMIASLNRFIKEHGNSIVSLVTLYTVYLGAVTAKMNKEVVENTLENNKALDKAIEERRQIAANYETFFSNVKEYQYKWKGFELTVNKLESEARSVNSALTEVEQLREEQDLCIKNYFNTSDSTEKIILQSKILELSRKIKRGMDNAKEINSKALDIATDLSHKMDVLDSQNSSLVLEEPSNKEISEDIKKMSFIDLDWFSNLDLIKQLAISLLFCQSVVLSALTSIIFTTYGDYLINKFNLESKYPKLSTIIKYRKQFSKYYFIHSCFMIALISFAQIAFAIAVLSL